MSAPRFFCSGLFPYTFQNPGMADTPYPVVIGVFTELGKRHSLKQFFYSKCQIIAFMEEHLGLLDQASVTLLTTVLDDYGHLPFEAEYEDHMVGNNNAGVFFVLAHCLETLPGTHPVSPLELLPL